MADKTVVVASSGGNYTSLNAALSNEAADLTSASYNEGGPGRLIIDCESFEDTTEVDTTGQTWTTSSDYYVLIRATDDHGGKYSSSAYRHKYSGTNEGVDFADIGHVWLRGVQFISAGTTSGSRAVEFNANSAGFVKIEKCIVFQDSSTTGMRGLMFNESLTNAYVWNTVVYGFDGAGIHHASANEDLWVYNCTIDDCGDGIDTSAANRVRVKNTRITSCTTVIDEVSGALHTDSDYNLTDAATGPTNWGTNSVTSATTAYVDDTNATLTSRDYHIQSGDDGIGAGTDLSADSDLAFSDDIDGDSRS